MAEYVPSERLKVPRGEPRELDSQNHRDLIVEIGPGHSWGSSAYDLSEDVRERVARGASYKAVDNARESLAWFGSFPGERGTVVPENTSVQHVSALAYLSGSDDDGSVQTLVMNNVLGEKQDDASDRASFHDTENLRSVVKNIARKLRVGGEAIITETRTPNEKIKSLLGDVNFVRDLGLSVQIADRRGSVPSFDMKLESMGMRDPGCHPFLAPVVKQEAFVIILRKEIVRSGE